MAGFAFFFFGEWVINAFSWIGSTLFGAAARGGIFIELLTNLGVTKIEAAVLFGLLMFCAWHLDSPNRLVTLGTRVPWMA